MKTKQYVWSDYDAPRGSLIGKTVEIEVITRATGFQNGDGEKLAKLRSHHHWGVIGGFAEDHGQVFVNASEPWDEAAREAVFDEEWTSATIFLEGGRLITFHPEQDHVRIFVEEAETSLPQQLAEAHAA